MVQVIGIQQGLHPEAATRRRALAGKSGWVSSIRICYLLENVLKGERLMSRQGLCAIAAFLRQLYSLL